MTSPAPRDGPDQDAPDKVESATPPKRGGISLSTQLRRTRLLKFFSGGWRIVRPRKTTSAAGLLSWLPGAHVTDAEIRAEIWSLGARHQGWPLEGALAELKTGDLPAQRVSLLRACVRKLQHP